MPNRIWLAPSLALAMLLSACGSNRAPRTPDARAGDGAPRHGVIPLPSTIDISPGASFAITATMAILYEPSDDPRILSTATRLANLLASALPAPPPVRPISGSPPAGSIVLSASAAASSLGDEGYELTITADGIRVASAKAAGLFYGVQTLRQLLPWSIEYQGAGPRPIAVPLATIQDRPRFVWRGAMLDVARHFFTVDDVKRYIDLIALYKMNRLHLHLSDDQGWRIEITSWPNLTAHGGDTEVGGGAGGFYTQAQYADIVKYAHERFITVVPEIDMPSHTNAALASYAELNCDGQAPPLYTGIDVGFSTLCVDKDVTYRFIADVVREIGALTVGPYLPHRRRREQEVDAGAVSDVHRARAVDRSPAGQGGGRLGRHRSCRAPADDDRAALAPGSVARGSCERRQADRVAGLQELSRYEVRQDDRPRIELGRRDRGADRV